LHTRPLVSMDPPTLTLVSKVLSNAISNSSNLSKYGRVNLTGKAGGRLRASEPAMRALGEAGWVVQGDEIVLKDVTDDTRRVADRVRNERDSAAKKEEEEEKKDENNESSSGQTLSLRQQANREREEREKRERIEKMAANKKSRKNSKNPSMKSQAKQQLAGGGENEFQRKKREKEELLRKFEEDNYVRKNDDNWSASTAGDKSKGKSMQTFRDKMGEDSGG